MVPALVAAQLLLHCWMAVLAAHARATCHGAAPRPHLADGPGARRRRPRSPRWSGSCAAARSRSCSPGPSRAASRCPPCAAPSPGMRRCCRCVARSSSYPFVDLRSASAPPPDRPVRPLAPRRKSAMHVRRTLARLGATAGAAGLLTLGLAAPASAHVTVTPSDTAAGAFAVLTFSVPPRLRGLAHHRHHDPGPGGDPLGHADPQRAVRGREDDGAARRAGRGRPRQRASPSGSARSPTRRGARCPTATATPSSCRCSCPDAAGETLAFPVIQTCEKGETALDGGRRPKGRTPRSSSTRRPR